MGVSDFEPTIMFHYCLCVTFFCKEVYERWDYHRAINEILQNGFEDSFGITITTGNKNKLVSLASSQLF